MMTRVMLIFLVATAMAMLLAGCRSSQREDQGSSQGSQQEDGSSQQTSEVMTNEQTSEPTMDKSVVGRCADSGSTGGQQEEASRGEVSNGKIAFERRKNGDGYTDIFVVDEKGAHETRLTRSPQYEQGPVWSPDRAKIAFARDSMSIYVMDADGANVTRLVGNSYEEGAYDYNESLGSPVWSPDGGKLAFVTRSSPSDGLSVMNADCTNRTQLQPKIFTRPDRTSEYGTYQTSLNEDSLVWSPTGKKLAFGSYTELDSDASASASAPVKGLTGIYLINVDGTGLRKLTGSHDEKTELMTPVWSPDGGKIAFLNVGMINVIHPDGSGRKELTRTVGAKSAPAWSPDGKKIAYIANSGLYVINADGTGREKLAGGARGLAQHAWSPDGQRIAFFCPGNTDVADNSLCAINADGTERTQLARDISSSGYPAFAAWGSG